MSDFLALADVAAMDEQKRSREEEEFESIGPALIEDAYRQIVRLMLYQRMRYIVPGGWYTPDFNAILDDGRQVHVEVKGSKRQRNYRDARSKLRAAAALYPFYIWLEARRERGNWTLEEIREEWQ